MKILLRTARADDFEKLWTLDQECFPAGVSYSRAELAAYLGAERSFALIAEPLSAARVPAKSEGRSRTSLPPAGLLGFVIAEVGRRGMGHVITIDVAAAARRFGVGSRLLLAAENRLLAGKCRAARLEAAVDNVAALSFYKRRQYHVVRTIPRYYGNGVDALVLEKDLSSGAASDQFPL